MKRYVAIFSLILFILVIIWLFIEGMKPEVLPIGSIMPEISYTDINETTILKRDNNTHTLIVFFSEKCQHCQFELNELNKNINKLENVRVYLFTSDKRYLESENIKKYTALLNSTSTTFGIINLKEYKNKFGGTATPIIYFFNDKCALFAKKIGAAKFENINNEINKELKNK